MDGQLAHHVVALGLYSSQILLLAVNSRRSMRRDWSCIQATEYAVRVEMKEVESLSLGW